MSGEDKSSIRRKIIEALCQERSVVEELLVYNAPAFSAPDLSLDFPLRSEPHVACWRAYLNQSIGRSLFEELSQRLVELRFAIRTGMSSNEAYRNATRKGIDPDPDSHHDGLVLEQPHELQLSIYATIAGEIPILEVAHRNDFESLVRALVFKNEPEPIPKSMGAIIVSGYNNWDRIHAYRDAWERKNPAGFWPFEFSQFLAQKELYQDCFMILSEGPYSSVPAAELGLEEETWRRFSKLIRREHECAHYFTRRVFATMRNNIMDELIADYMGIIAAQGRYRADWFHRFMGLASLPNFQVGRRLENYRGTLSDPAFTVLQVLTKAASDNLQTFDRSIRARGYQPELRSNAYLLMALTQLTLEELASSEGAAMLDASYQAFRRSVSPNLRDENGFPVAEI